ncbi:MAG: hypothetical protein Q8Q09_14885 [Deltaproteobacteria bacterium]|nr:hypothetical protein [Deltaproteobacteria bacterium]
MSEPDNLSDQDASEPVRQTPSPRPNGRIRLVLGLTLLGTIAAFSLTGIVTIYRATLAGPTAPSRFHSCEDGLRGLYAGYARQLSPVELGGEQALPRTPHTVPTLTSDLRVLDDALRDLAPRCASEGRDGQAAFSALERWRHRSEDNARLLEQQVTPDAVQALHYRSPRTQPNR